MRCLLLPVFAKRLLFLMICACSKFACGLAICSLRRRRRFFLQSPSSSSAGRGVGIMGDKESSGKSDWLRLLLQMEKCISVSRICSYLYLGIYRPDRSNAQTVWVLSVSLLQGSMQSKSWYISPNLFNTCAINLLKPADESARFRPF